MSNNCLLLKSTFLRAPLANGVGRYVPQLVRITFKYCKNWGSSRGLRDFLENDLVNFAKDNPGVVVYVKPRRHRGPVIVGEYLSGERHWLPVKDFDRETIIKWVELMRTEAKDRSEVRLRKLQHTEFPSIQGVWNPFMFKNPLQNITEYPDPTCVIKPRRKSATEALREIYESRKAIGSSESSV